MQTIYLKEKIGNPDLFTGRTKELSYRGVRDNIFDKVFKRNNNIEAVAS